MACRGMIGAIGLLAALAACGGSNGPAPSPLPSPPVVETPLSFAYLQDVSTGSAVVSRYAADGDLYSVEWSGSSSWAVLGRATESVSRPTHPLRLEPLSADTSYRYRLRSGSGRLLAEGVFTTPPPPLTRAVTFAAISDSGWHGGAEWQVADAIRASTPAPELLIHCGDVVYPSGELQNYAAVFFDPFARVLDHVPIFPTIGNHDLETAGGAGWNAVFLTPANGPQRSPRYYSFDWGDVHFSAVDVASTPHSPGSPEWAFLAEDLRAARTAWKVVYLHYPPFSCGPNGGSSEVQRTLVPLFEASAVDVVIAGHDHVYERFHRRQGVLYVVSGGGGAPPDPTQPCDSLVLACSVNHFLRGRADARTLRLEAVDVGGAPIDSVTLQR